MTLFAVLAVSCFAALGCDDRAADTAETADDTAVEADPCPADDPRRRTFYRDADQDGFGDAETSVEACVEPEGHVRSATDCDDTDGDIFPGAPELCDGKDNNCNDRIDDTVLGTAQECAAESCRQVTDDRDLPSDGSQRTTVWLRDAAGPYQATCYVESPSKAWTEVTVSLAVQRGWIRMSQLAGAGASPRLQADSGGLVIGPSAIYDYVSPCDSDVLRATLTLPFPYEQVSGRIRGNYEGFDLQGGTYPPSRLWELQWGEQLPAEGGCIGGWLLGIPGQRSLRADEDEWLWRPSAPYDLRFELDGLDSPELAVELNAATHRNATGGLLPSELRVTEWTMLFR